MYIYQLHWVTSVIECAYSETRNVDTVIVVSIIETVQFPIRYILTFLRVGRIFYHNEKSIKEQ